MWRGAGDMRERLVIQSPIETSDTQGGRAVVWTTVATVWAMVRPLGATERLTNETVGSHATYAVEMQYRPDVTPSMRLSWQPYQAPHAKTLQIIGVQPMAGAPVRLQLLCGEVV